MIGVQGDPIRWWIIRRPLRFKAFHRVFFLNTIVDKSPLHWDIPMIFFELFYKMFLNVKTNISHVNESTYGQINTMQEKNISTKLLSWIWVDQRSVSMHITWVTIRCLLHLHCFVQVPVIDLTHGNCFLKASYWIKDSLTGDSGLLVL